MQTLTKELQEAVLNLPVEERVRILELLLVSLEPEHVVQESWLKLAEQRREEVRAGKVTMVPGDEAISRIRKRLT